MLCIVSFLSISCNDAIDFYKLIDMALTSKLLPIFPSRPVTVPHPFPWFSSLRFCNTFELAWSETAIS